jgi:hypothetical protein
MTVLLGKWFPAFQGNSASFYEVKVYSPNYTTAYPRTPESLQTRMRIPVLTMMTVTLRKHFTVAIISGGITFPG